MAHTFWIKAGLAAALVLLADQVVPHLADGIGLGLFACGWLLALLLARGDLRRSRAGLVAWGMAALFAGAMVLDPGPLAWLLFWCALSIAALLPRAGAFDDAARWGLRLAAHGLSVIVRAPGDLLRLRRSAGGGRHGWAIVGILALPLAGTILFGALFAAANPLIEGALAAIRLPPLWRVVLWLLLAAALWPSLRPHPAVPRLARGWQGVEPVLPGTTLPSVLIALALFNALFAVQNGLDLAILWSGTGLPAGMTQIEYVHRGAYPLIVTALIAGVLALAMLRPGSAAAGHPWARLLLALWVGQNLLLVASSALRTIDYIATSMLTGWRIAALLWMGLVATGLVLIGWRILRGRSARWLINSNAAAALLVLVPCTFVDLGGYAAAWNVRAGPPHKVDLCYLHQVGPGALLPLIRLEGRRMDPATRDRVRFVRETILTRLEQNQADWMDWTPRGAWRLATARARMGGMRAQPLPIPAGAWRDCDGTIRLPPA